MEEAQNVETTEFVARNLASFSEYEFYVAAANSIGRSALSPSLDVTTGESGRWFRAASGDI